jgi:hypothetical protein
MKLIPSLLAAAALAATASVQAQVKWDLPAAYPAANFHSVNLQRRRSSVRCRAGRRRSARSCW